jgi:hypothetical protein
MGNFFHGVIVTLVAQVKEGLYCDRYPTHVFLPLIIKGFECLHQQAFNFLYRYANMAWTTKGNKPSTFFMDVLT